MRKIRIPMASLEESLSVKRVEEVNRTDSSIVRIMAADKTLGYQQLIDEVLVQLSFFKFDPKIIQRDIEALVPRAGPNDLDTRAPRLHEAVTPLSQLRSA